MTELRRALDDRDLPRVGFYVGYTCTCLPSVPLTLRGISPSSTRVLIQLDAVAPKWKERVCEWQGSAQLSKDEVVALLPVTSECVSLIQRAHRSPWLSQWGDTFTYIGRKAEWMTANGYHREAVHLMWYLAGAQHDVIRSTTDPLVASRSRELVDTWFRAVGWEGQDVLEEKVRMAEEMVAEMEALAAGIPTA